MKTEKKTEATSDTVLFVMLRVSNVIRYKSTVNCHETRIIDFWILTGHMVCFCLLTSGLFWAQIGERLHSGGFPYFDVSKKWNISTGFSCKTPLGRPREINVSFLDTSEWWGRLTYLNQRASWHTVWLLDRRVQKKRIGVQPKKLYSPRLFQSSAYLSSNRL